MSDFESLDYLATGFDPASLTVPRLRSILVAHDVEYPSGAKKPQLIQIFNDEVLPQKRKLLAARAKVRRMSKGILDADSQESTQDSNLTEEGEEQLPPRRRPGRPSKTPTRARSDEVEELDLPRTRSPTKRSRTPRASAKHHRSSDTETTDADLLKQQLTARKSRNSEVPAPATTPKVKEEEDEDVSRANRRVSNFTYDNPFQSGSSPVERHTSGEKKRKSLGSTSKDVSRRKSSAPSRRHTDVLNGDDDIHPPSSTTFEIPVSELNGLRDVDENGVIMDEEFTPEEQLELIRERSVKGINALGPRRPQRKQPNAFSWRKPLWILALALVAGYSSWYRQQKVAVGYCGIGKEPMQIIPDSIQVPDWTRVLVEPECELCPQHAYCSGNMETQCETDFVLKPHPLSLWGVLPFPPTCEPDGEKVRKVKAVADRAVEELRERRAKHECGELTNELGGKAAVEIAAHDLKKEVSQKRRRGMTEAEFEELWSGAIGEIEGREEVVRSGNGTQRFLTSTSLARLPLGCTIKRSFRLALARHRLEIVAVALLVGLVLYIRGTISSRNKANAAVPNLVSITLDRLATQASLHTADKEAYPEGWISIGQLRDDVLRDEHSLSKREVVWHKVRKVVEMNANVRASQREGRNGEISRVWEWIGAVGDFESGGRRRKSGRVSWGVYDENSSPVSGKDEGPEVIQKKWEEGRPIY